MSGLQTAGSSPNNFAEFRKRQKIEDGSDTTLKNISKPKKVFKKKKRKIPQVQDGSGEDVLLREIRTILGVARAQEMEENDEDEDSPLQTGEVLELNIGGLSSTG